MAAEASASQIVADARRKKTERMKEAKSEAETEINAYRQEKLSAYELSSTDGDNSAEFARLQSDTQNSIAAMTRSFEGNKGAVLDLMSGFVTDVVLQVPEARKNKNK
jgi:V-type H+-transporting ATPase subunit G